VQLKLRFDEGLRGRLERQARQKGRSLNAEIIHRLRESFNYDFVKWQADNLLQTSAFDTSHVANVTKRMVEDVIKSIVEQVAQVRVAAQKQKPKPKDESK
jgi:hypothetical protein